MQDIDDQANDYAAHLFPLICKAIDNVVRSCHIDGIYISTPKIGGGIHDSNCPKGTVGWINGERLLKDLYSLAYVERAGGGIGFLCDKVCSQKKSQPNSHNQSQKWALFKLSGCQGLGSVKVDFIKK